MSDFKPKLEFRDPRTLIPYEKNAKVHTKKQVKNIAQSISKFGFAQPIVIDKEGVIVLGHGRREAAIMLDLKEVPVFVAHHLSEDETMALRIADNRVADAPWNTDLLKFELNTLSLHKFDMSHLGFDLDELNKFIMDGEIIPEFLGSNKVANDESKPVEVFPVHSIEPAEKKEAVGAIEVSEEEFSEFDHKCPKCGFEFDELS